MVACRCWHRLEKVSEAKLTHHVCCIDPTKWAGEEKKGLVPGRAFKPDAYIEPNLPIHLEGQTSGPKGAVYLFHGNEWHGYPEGHPKYDEVNYCGDSYKERYHKTLAQAPRSGAAAALGPGRGRRPRATWWRPRAGLLALRRRLASRARTARVQKPGYR